MLILEIIPKTIWNCIIAFFVLLVTKHVTHLVKKYQNEHIICYTFLFLIEKSFWKMSSLLHYLTYLSLLNSFLLLSTFSVFMKNLNNFFSDGLFTSFFLADFQSFFCIQLFPRFSWSRFFRIQIFLCSSFLGSRFFWVRVQGLGPGSRSRF